MEPNNLSTEDYSPIPQAFDLEKRGSSEDGGRLLPNSLSSEKDVIEPVSRETLGPLAKRTRNCTRTDLIFDTKQKPFGDTFHCLKFPLLLFTLVIPLIGLVAWFVIMAPTVKLFGSFAGIVIGGRFSQSTAKGIDIIYSGLLAPALMTALNFVWFSSARLAIRASRGKPQEQQRRIPLATWVTACGMSTGSYNVKNFLSLRRGRMWRLHCLILLALSTAFTWTALSNIIAYEAYTETIPSNINNKLRTLNDMVIDSQTHTTDNDPMRESVPLLPEDSFKLNLQQQATIYENLTSLLNQMATFNSSSLDSEGGYVVVNATDSSLADLEPSVVALYHVPAFRLSAICEPALFLPASIYIDAIIEDVVRMLGMFSSPNTTAEWYTYWYAGVAEDLNSSYMVRDMKPYSFFSENYQQVVLGYWESNMGDGSPFWDKHTGNNTLTTQYGEIKPAVLYNTSIGSILNTHSLHCSLSRQEGFVNYTRSIGQTWKLSGSKFEPSKSPQRSFMGDWQIALNYHAMTEGGTVPGIAPAIRGGLACEESGGEIVVCPSINFSTFAANFVLASGRAQSILFNVAAMNSSRDQPEYFYNVAGAVTQQFYHITYVPALLLASLLGIIIAASTAVGMTVYARWIQRGGMKTLHEVTPLRLVVDSGAGTLQHTASMTRLANLSDSQLQTVAKEVYIMY